MNHIIKYKIFEGIKEDTIKEYDDMMNKISSLKANFNKKIDSYILDLIKVYDHKILDNKRYNDDKYFFYNYYWRFGLDMNSNKKTHLFKRYKILNMVGDIIDVADKIKDDLGIEMEFKCRLIIGDSSKHHPSIWWKDKEDFIKSVEEYAKRDFGKHLQGYANPDVIYRRCEIDMRIKE